METHEWKYNRKKNYIKFISKDGWIVFNDGWIHEYNNQLIDEDNNVYNVTEFKTIENTKSKFLHALLRPIETREVWSAVKLDKEIKNQNYLYVNTTVA